jgi:hypothetical protein
MAKYNKPLSPASIKRTQDAFRKRWGAHEERMAAKKAAQKKEKK